MMAHKKGFHVIERINTRLLRKRQKEGYGFLVAVEFILEFSTQSSTTTSPIVGVNFRNSFPSAPLHHKKNLPSKRVSIDLRFWLCVSQSCNDYMYIDFHLGAVHMSIYGLHTYRAFIQNIIRN